MSTDFLLPAEVQMMKDDFDDLAGDAQLGVSITYRRFTGKSAFSGTTGQVTPTFSDVTVNALRVPLDQEEIVKSNGHYQAGDYKYLIGIGDISAPKKDDRITDATIERYFIDSSFDIVGIFYSVTARSLNG